MNKEKKKTGIYPASEKKEALSYIHENIYLCENIQCNTKTIPIIGSG
jgi:hypothetical protein